MPADLILHARWCGASLSAMPAGVLPHYQPCLLVWCHTIDHAVWRGASLSAMHAGVLPHYRTCMLLWCLTIGHACWSNANTSNISTSRVQMEEGWLQVWCYFYRGAITSDMPADPMPLVQCNSIRHACWVRLFGYACLQSAALSCKASGLLQVHQTCLQVRCRSHTL